MNYCVSMQLLVAAILVLGCSQLGSTQVPCNGVLTGIILTSVTCTGDCTLDNADISGNVMCSTGSLLAKGGSSITGSVTLSGSVTMAELDDVTVSGSVSANSASSLTKLIITQLASISGSVLVDNTPGDVVVSGTVGGLKLTNSGDLLADNFNTLATVLVTGGDGIVQLCSSSVGGLTLVEHTGNVEIDANAPNCGQTTLNGFSASKGSGTVQVVGADISAGDFSVTEQNGDVTLQTAQVSDIILSKNTGSLTLRDTSADSDLTITDQDGNVILDDLTFLGDFTVTGTTGDVTLKETDANLEDISIKLTGGAVTVQGNTNLNLVVEETSGMVQITGNSINNANVNKNTGGVDFDGNTITFLSCTDNNPAPTGSDNTVTTALGQCSSGFP